MQIRLNVHDADASGAIRSYVERRLHFALGRFGQRVGRITVGIRTDGPDGNQCRIRVEVVPFGQVIAEQTDSDLFAAVDQASGRIGRLFAQELERMRNSRVGRESVRVAA